MARINRQSLYVRKNSQTGQIGHVYGLNVRNKGRLTETANGKIDRTMSCIDDYTYNQTIKRMDFSRTWMQKCAARLGSVSPVLEMHRFGDAIDITTSKRTKEAKGIESAGLRNGQAAVWVHTDICTKYGFCETVVQQESDERQACRFRQDAASRLSGP